MDCTNSPRMHALARRKSIFTGLIAVVVLITQACLASAETRVALVIGNSDYRNTNKLPNPRNDATDVAAALKRLGFSTLVGLDLDKAGMDDFEIRFARMARGADFAIFYYSGHAIQYAATNYLLPIDAEIKDAADLRRLSKVDDIVADLQQAKDLRILVLDSCRDDPLADELKRSLGERSASVERGLARLGSSRGMIVAYSTLAGQTADDGHGRNSPYTAAFLKEIETPEEISTVFRRVATDVIRATENKQYPELVTSLYGDFYLGGKADPATPPPLSGTAQPNLTGMPKQPESSQDEIAWSFVKDTTDAALLRQFIAEFPASRWRGDAESRLAALTSQRPPVASLPTAPASNGLNKSSDEGRNADQRLTRKEQNLRPSESPNARCFTFNGQRVCE
jgi:Caspase domain